MIILLPNLCRYIILLSFLNGKTASATADTASDRMEFLPLIYLFACLAMSIALYCAILRSRYSCLSSLLMVSVCSLSVNVSFLICIINKTERKIINKYVITEKSITIYYLFGIYNILLYYTLYSNFENLP